MYYDDNCDDRMMWWPLHEEDGYDETRYLHYVDLYTKQDLERLALWQANPEARRQALTDILEPKPSATLNPKPSATLNPAPFLSFPMAQSFPVPSPEKPLFNIGSSFNSKQDSPPQPPAVMAQPKNVLAEQYENQIRPCIDLIDSLRSLGVEKDLGLPAIAVIGDQSSGKSSVLEALSGVSLPRGSGIVTRCPLELKLKKTPKDSHWSGKICYRKQEKELKSPSEVEKEVRAAQDFMAGTGCGISEELITLEIASPNVPDLTLIDLPGITRVALPNQPPDIGQQIKRMISKYITRQETINLAVVPSNVDIATTEALEMARQVDPNGERTLGILTKPDLVDIGAEADIVNIVRNLVCPLKKGYMIVKCRGQSEIQKNISLEDAIRNERVFFENHEHFSALLNEDQATIPLLAERLTLELVEHINRTLPNLDDQMSKKLREAEEKLNLIGYGVPETDMEKMTFLIEKIRSFADEIGHATKGEEEVYNGHLKLFTELRKEFYDWENILATSSKSFSQDLKKDVYSYEHKHRGRELTGFVSFQTFENITRKKIVTFQEPAMTKLNRITELIRTSFNNIAVKHFQPFPNLYRSTKGKLENIFSVQRKDAEVAVQTQFKMENIIYCQDTLYGGSLKDAREEEEKAPAFPKFSNSPPSHMQLTIEEMSNHVKAYFKTATERLGTQIPLIIQHYLLFEFARQLQVDMMMLIQDRENLGVLLQEKQDLSRERKSLKDQIGRLKAAQERLARFPN